MPKHLCLPASAKPAPKGGGFSKRPTFECREEMIKF